MSDCNNCHQPLDFDFTMAFQPIVRLSQREVFAQEALVRGLNNEPAGKIFESVNDDNLYRFDQTCRVKAVELASKLGINSNVSINFLPNAVYQPELCIRTTVEAAEKHDYPIENIIFEVTEAEKIVDQKKLRDIIEHYQQRGFKTAIDDFGAGYAGLNLLADIQTDLIKLDIALIKEIDKDKVRQSIVKGIMQVCTDLNIEVIGEGVETVDELKALRDLGIDLFQGFHFARPEFEGVASISDDAFI